MALEPTRQFHASEVSHADGSTSQGADHAVYQSAESQMSSDSSPATRKLGVGIPSHTELQRQGVANNDPGRRFARDAVRSRSRNRSWRNGLGCSVYQYIHARSNVQVTELECAGQRNDHGCVDVAQASLAICIFCSSFLELFLQCARRERLGGYAAGQGCVIVDVELKEVEEWVVDKVNCAVDVLLYAEEELERATGFIASRERDVR